MHSINERTEYFMALFEVHEMKANMFFHTLIRENVIRKYAYETKQISIETSNF